MYKKLTTKEQLDRERQRALVSQSKSMEVEQELKEENKSLKKAVQKLIIADDLEPEELQEMINIYDKWEDLEEGQFIKELTYLQYQGNLYQCRAGEGHPKQSTWKPNVAHSQFKAVSPEGVIPAWVSGKGYDEGARVTHNGFIWTSKHAGNIAEPSEDGGHFRFWEQGASIK